jgi:SHS2 domain-containing protein
MSSAAGYHIEAIDHTADKAVRVHAETLPLLLEACAFAMFGLMADLDAIRPEVERQWTVTAPSLEGLLVEWLRELLFTWEVDGVFWTRFRVDEARESPPEANATAWGVPSSQVQITGAAVKAITYHALEVRRDERGWHAQLVFDV